MNKGVDAMFPTDMSIQYPLHDYRQDDESEDGEDADDDDDGVE